MPRPYEDVEDLCGMLGLTCTPDFAAPLIADQRERILFGGWRAAKTVRAALSAMLLIMDWYGEHVQGKGRRRLIWLVGPDYKQTAEEYRYLGEWLTRLRLLSQPPSIAMEGPRQLLLTFNVVIETKSADHPETLASVAPDLIVACEPGQMSDEVRDMLLGRSLERNAPIVWGGTVENDEGHPTWAWYQETARAWLDNPTDRHKAWSLPTWDNPLFGTCAPWVDEDPSLAQFCPDSNHGPAHGGRLHPVIHQFEVPAEQGGKGYDGFTFARRIAAIPTGAQYAIYPQTIRESLIMPVPQSAIRGFFASTGGLDYGWADHPSVLAVVQFTEDPRDAQESFVGPKGIAWVREVRYLDTDPGDTIALDRARKELGERWHCYRWNIDPMQTYAARSFDPGLQNVMASESKREARIGLLTGRFNYRKLFFDLDGPGVSRAYEEFKVYHRRKTRMGKLEVLREGEDGVAAVEDAIEAFDGEPRLAVRRSVPMPKRRTREPSYSRRV